MRALLPLVPVVLSACSLVPGVTGPAALLEGTSWTARSLPGTAGAVPVPSSQTLTVTFGAGGQLTGKADCNSMFGRYTATPPATVSIREIGQTRMFCGAGSLGDAFIQALEASRSYAVVGNTLTLRAASGGLVMLERAGTAAAPITGVEWKATAITTGGATQAVPSSQTFTLTLHATGSAGGRAHCNSYGGPYTMGEGAALRFGDITSTLVYCGDGSLDQRFHEVLRGVRTYALDGSTLTLRAENGDAITLAR